MKFSYLFVVYLFVVAVLALAVISASTSIAPKQGSAEQPETYQLMGKVVNEETGQGLADVEVDIPEKEGEEQERTETTNEDGEFTFTQLNAGQHTISIDHEGYEKWEKQIRIMQDSQITIELTPEK